MSSATSGGTSVSSSASSGSGATSTGTLEAWAPAVSTVTSPPDGHVTGSSSLEVTGTAVDPAVPVSELQLMIQPLIAADVVVLVERTEMSH